MAVLFGGASDEKTKRWDVRCLILERRSRMQGGNTCLQSQSQQWPLRLPIKYFLASIHAGKPPGLQNRAPVVARGVGVRLSEATPHAEDVPSSSRGACPSRLSLNLPFQNSPPLSSLHEFALALAHKRIHVCLHN